MNTKLNHIQNWEELIQEAKWQVSTLAKLCGVSERTLRRYIQDNWQQQPKAWMTIQRQKQAIKLLMNGSSVKETAESLGYQNPETFSREFKKHNYKCPIEVAQILISTREWPKKL
jgi:AraC-like DNA-binding protein